MPAAESPPNPVVAPSAAAAPVRPPSAGPPVIKFDTPCTFKAASGAFAAGVLGYIFGFLPSLVRNRSLKSYKIWMGDGMRSAQSQSMAPTPWHTAHATTLQPPYHSLHPCTPSQNLSHALHHQIAAAVRQVPGPGLWLLHPGTSAKSLALVSGSYTLAQCICYRLRLVDDGVNRGIAGCASGLAMGWAAGPTSAFNSCLGLGLFSYVFDFGGEAEPVAHAAGLGAPGPRSCVLCPLPWEGTQTGGSAACCKGCTATGGACSEGTAEVASCSAGGVVGAEGRGALGRSSASGVASSPGRFASLTCPTIKLRTGGKRSAQGGQLSHGLGPPVMWLGAITASGASYLGGPHPALTHLSAAAGRG
eukprot:gene1955-33368_t